MSADRDTINAVLRVAQLDADSEPGEFPTVGDFGSALTALDRIAAECDRHREALERIANMGVVFDAKGTRSRQVCDIARGALVRGES